MRKGLLPKHLRDIVLVGFEPKKDDKDDKGDKPDDDTGDSDDEDEEDEDDDKGGEDKDDKAADNAGLVSALGKERTARKKLEKENRRLAKIAEAAADKDKSETDKAKDDATKATSKAEKLAAKLKDSTVDNVVTKLATKLKFRDIDDALKLIDRSEIEVEQDEDEPDDVDVDEATVEAALKKLAKAKPHLIVAEGQEDKSGSKFNGKGKSGTEADEDKLADQYPALANRRQQLPKST